MNSTYELITATAERVPEQVALRFLPNADLTSLGETWRYRQLHEQITRFANWLHAHSVGPGDAVSIVLPNLPQFHFAFWGAQAAAIANPINPFLDASHISAIMRKARAQVLVTLAPSASSDDWAKIESVSRQVPSLRHILTIDPTQPSGEPGASETSPVRLDDLSVTDFERALAEQPGERLQSGRRFKPSDVAAYFHTGGTTGIPKIAPHTHGNEVAMAQSLASALEMQNGKFLCGLPLFHVNGVMVTGLLPFLLGGSVLLLTAAGYRGPGVLANFWKLVERHAINIFSGVPTIYSSLLEVPVGDADVSSLRYGLCGAAPLSPELMRRFEAATGIRLLEGYGLTEATCVSTLNPVRGERLVGSIGKALPGIEVKAVELDAQGGIARDCPEEVIGQLVVRGPTVFPGYLNEAGNSGAMLPGGWLKTGDLGRRDARGYFWLVGRAKDLIIRGGHNIDPAAIEEPLCRHPSVALAAAIGRPDRHAGELPVAYVELRKGHQVEAETLLQYAVAHISEKGAVPKAIHIIDQMPLTAVGKVFKPALVWRETEDVFAAALSVVPGIARATVVVSADERHGALARVSIRPAPGSSQEQLSQAANLVLGEFNTRYEIAFEETNWKP